MSVEDKKQAEKPQPVEDKQTRRERLRRKIRKHLRNRGPLIVKEEDKKANFKYRWVNDVTSRLEDKVDIGYTFVIDDEGKKRSKLVSKTDKELRAYLMAVPKEIYDEVQAIKAEDNSQLDKAMGRDYELTNDGHVVKKVYN